MTGFYCRGMGITAAQAARNLGCSRNHVYRLARQGRLPRGGEPHTWGRYDRATIEALSLATLGQHGGHEYWATTAGAADILGVTPNRVRQLADLGRVPAVGVPPRPTRGGLERPACTEARRRMGLRTRSPSTASCPNASANTRTIELSSARFNRTRIIVDVQELDLSSADDDAAGSNAAMCAFARGDADRGRRGSVRDLRPHRPQD